MINDFIKLIKLLNDKIKKGIIIKILLLKN